MDGSVHTQLCVALQVPATQAASLEINLSTVVSLLLATPWLL
mgnify:CR=1 FL=1